MIKDEQIAYLSIHDAEERMHHCLESGAVVAGRHFRQELANEGISLQDAWIVLHQGHIYDAPEMNVKTGEWNYRMEGPEPDGKWVAIVFSFKAVDIAFMITAFTAKRRREKK